MNTATMIAISSAAITSCSVFPSTRPRSSQIGRSPMMVEPNLSVTASSSQ